MTYTVCITLPKDYYTINLVNEDDVKFMAASFEEGRDHFFYAGTKYNIKDIMGFHVFGYDDPEDWTKKINATEEIKREGLFRNGFVYFPPNALAKLFTNVTGSFIRRYSTGRSGEQGYTSPLYVNTARIDALRSKCNNSFDLRRVVKICDEINRTYADQCCLSTIFLVRSLLDHIPPVFEKKSFAEVANNYGGKSFKDTMLTLENSSRKIADLYLHTQIKAHETLPLEQQVNFSQALDLLLAEVIALT